MQVRALIGGSIPAHAGETSWPASANTLSGVDPRSRGGDAVIADTTEQVRGRSPLTRGRPVARASWRSIERSIPAHAGETDRLGAAGNLAGVDPRSRGGDLGFAGNELREQGRSPLTRGRPIALRSTDSARGSIPAHAGETRLGNEHANGRGVDPRSRGGDVVVYKFRFTSEGRSPLTRGRLHNDGWNGVYSGSIPAHAGETNTPTVSTPSDEVDPRSRGGDRLPT